VVTRSPCYTDFVALRNVTITLDEGTARWARVEAARQGKSVSKYVGELLRGSMLEQEAYGKAMASYMSRSPVQLSRRRYPRREEVYERSRLR